MTPPERAEKMAEYLKGHLSLDPTFWKEDLLKYLPPLIAEAEREAKLAGFMEAHNMSIQSGASANCEKHASIAKAIGRKEGFTAAREQAAGIAEGPKYEDDVLAMDIRAMEPPK